MLDDDRFSRGSRARAPIRSWAGIPLLVEGEVIGLLCLDRHRVDPFEDEDLHRAKAVAFSAAAAIRKAQLLEKVRRYAALMERLVQVDQAVFAGTLLRARRAADPGRRAAHRHLPRRACCCSRRTGGPPRVAAASGDVGLRPGGAGPGAARRRARPSASPPPRSARLAADSGITLPACGMFLVPLATADVHVGTLALLDPNGVSTDDRLMEAYASRAAAAYFHSTRKTPPPA